MQERPEKMSRKEGNACLKDLYVESHVISSLEIGPILRLSFQLRIMPALKLKWRPPYIIRACVD